MSVRLPNGFISAAEVVWHRMGCKDEHGIRIDEELEDNCRKQRRRGREWGYARITPVRATDDPFAI